MPAFGQCPHDGLVVSFLSRGLHEHCELRRGEERSHGERSCRSQCQSVVSARGVEHRDLHVPVVLSVSEVRRRPGRRLCVSSHVDHDGCGNVLVRVLVLLLLRRLAGRPDRRCRTRPVLAPGRWLLAARMRPAVPGSEPGPLRSLLHALPAAMGYPCSSRSGFLPSRLHGSHSGWCTCSS